MITSVLRKAFDLHNSGPHEQFAHQLQHVHQTKIFGTDNSPSQWRLQYEKDPAAGRITLESVQLFNSAAQAGVNSIDQIIVLSFQSNDGISNKLLMACTKYHEAMKLQISHRELSSDEIEPFQMLIGDFFELLINDFGSEGITNYIHILEAGHIMHFLNE
jgi:hypothetical protein